jgi:hypothetical protein
MERGPRARDQGADAVAVLAAAGSARGRRQEPEKDKAGRETVRAVVVEARAAVRGVARQRVVESEPQLEKGETIMPLGDGTGPAGAGPGSGRGGKGRGGGGMGRGGGGRGRMGGPQAAGPAGQCVCPKCGFKTAHTAGQPCTDQTCPKCGTAMARE